MKNSGIRLSRSGISLIVIILCCAGMMVFPAMGGERFISGSPDLSATINGANEFYPATEVNVPVNIQNSGLIEYVISQPNLLTPADLPNTAKLMTVQLFAGGAPLTCTLRSPDGGRSPGRPYPPGKLQGPHRP